MERTKTISLDKSKVIIKLVAFVIFLSIAIVAPFIKIQLITGSIVNAVLFISTATLGIGAGVLIGFLPSMISAFAGLLPIPLLPMIPYIIMGNAILVLTFGLLQKKKFLLGVISGSTLKFAFLFLTSSFIVSRFIEKPLPLVIINMMAWPQLITALIGGIIAYLILRIYEKKNIS